MQWDKGREQQRSRYYRPSTGRSSTRQLTTFSRPQDRAENETSQDDRSIGRGEGSTTTHQTEKSWGAPNLHTTVLATGQDCSSWKTWPCSDRLSPTGLNRGGETRSTPDGTALAAEQREPVPDNRFEHKGWRGQEPNTTGDGSVLQAVREGKKGPGAPQEQNPRVGQERRRSQGLIGAQQGELMGGRGGTGEASEQKINTNRDKDANKGLKEDYKKSWTKVKTIMFRRTTRASRQPPTRASARTTRKTWTRA